MFSEGEEEEENREIIKKIRHINDEIEKQDIFDIKDFYYINESLFEESREF